MADMNDISGLLAQLLSSAGESGEGGFSSDNENEKKAEAPGGGEGAFSGIDPELLIKIMEIASKLGENNKNTELLNALRPHLREENRRKLDKAAALMRLMSILPLLRGGN